MVRLANTGLVRARWSAAILDECFSNILENRPHLKPEALERTFGGRPLNGSGGGPACFCRLARGKHCAVAWI
jgi:hypothetical protein